MSGRFLVAYMAKLAIIFRIRNSKLGIFMFVINVLQKAEMVERNNKRSLTEMTQSTPSMANISK
jgi:hypothetical protein